MQMSRIRRGRGRFVVLVLLFASLVACGAAKPAAAPDQATRLPSATARSSPTAPRPAGALQGVIASSELVVGSNRFTMGILDGSGVPVPDAQVHLKFFQLSSSPAVAAPGGAATAQGVLRSEADAAFHSPGREAGLPAVETVVKPDGSKILVQSGGDEVGVYATTVSFDQPGDWGVEAGVSGKGPAQSGVVRTPFKVLPQGQTPALGSPAPRSHNLTASDVTDLSIVDTSAHPTADMHTETVADAIATGHPTLVLFATPGYCTSRLCGPELELARKLEPKYAGKVDFIHIEIYQDPSDPAKRKVMAAVEEWHLQSEPWFFVVDGKGNVAAKFEGPTTLAELDAALQKVAS